MATITDSTEQLSLLPSASVPARFRLSEATRRRGRQHAAEIRAQLAARREAEASNVWVLPRRPDRPGCADGSGISDHPTAA